MKSHVPDSSVAEYAREIAKDQNRLYAVTNDFAGVASELEDVYRMRAGEESDNIQAHGLSAIAIQLNAANLLKVAGDPNIGTLAQRRLAEKEALMLLGLEDVE